MRFKSEIFDEYSKICQENGLYSPFEKTAAEKESKELKQFKSDVYPRAGSDDISTIEALYGVKPKTDLEYERNIMEAAHKTPVVIGPAYDRINALVENENEGQNIRINLVMKPVDGIINNTKLAHNELLMELIRVANDMDNRDFQDIRVLADNCIEYLEKTAKKEEGRKLDPKAKLRNRGKCVFPAGRGKNKSEKDHYPINNEEQAKAALRYVGKQGSAPWYDGSVEDMRKAVERAVYREFPGLKKRHQEREKKSK